MKTLNTNTMNLEKRYESAKLDITNTFKTRYEDAIALGYDTLAYCTGGDWIYSLEPETMEFAKAIYRKVGNQSLYSVICKIMKSKNFKQIA